MSSRAAVESFWAAMQDNDWDCAAGHFTRDCVIDWPCSGERIVGRENFAAIQARYPTNTGRWSFDVHRMVAEEDIVVSEDRTVGNANHGAAPAWSPDGRTIAHQTRCGIRLVTPSGRAVYSSHLIRRTKGLGGGQERQKSPLARLSMEHDDGVRRLAGTPIVASDPLVAICSSVHVQSSGARSDQGRATCGVCC